MGFIEACRYRLVIFSPMGGDSKIENELTPTAKIR